MMRFEPHIAARAPSNRVEGMPSHASPDSGPGPGADLNLDPAATAAQRRQAWLEALGIVAEHYHLRCSTEQAKCTAQWLDPAGSEAAIAQMARTLGLAARLRTFDAALLTEARLPVILVLDDEQLAVVVARPDRQRLEVIFGGDRGMISTVTEAQLRHLARAAVVCRPLKGATDERADDYIKQYKTHWLRELVLRDWTPYLHVMLASLVANTLALAGVLFSMQVYDRVIPAQSFHTLYVLFSGVALAILFDFTLRRLRMRVVDLLGKRADLRVSDRVFDHALHIKHQARPQSTGMFIAQLRELEQVREMLTSTTVAAIADMPFFLLFCFVFWYLAGNLVWVPLAALAVLVAPGLIAQCRLRRYAQAAMREASLRNALLVESIQGLEDIKTLQAEQRFLGQWNHFNEITADAQLQLRATTNALTVWSHNVQNGVFAVVVLCGAPYVIAGDMTTGALVAASILSSRMMAPMGQLTQVLARWQQAKVAMNSLDSLMALPTDHVPSGTRIQIATVAGGYQIRNAVFRYQPNDAPVLAIQQLKIRPGEHVAVLGPNGSGKSTLLQALSGLLEPASGDVLLDNLALAHLDSAVVRRDVAYLSQHARLFHGSLRENLCLGAADASDHDIFCALDHAGAGDFVRRLPQGLDHQIREGGCGLSGGQRQAILLARTLLRKPNVLLMDEPTAAMDEATERRFVAQLQTWSQGRTVIIATHRMRVLDMVERIIVLDKGRILLDEAKDLTLQKLKPGTTAAAARATTAHTVAKPRATVVRPPRAAPLAP